jgi:hypothetical protein
MYYLNLPLEIWQYVLILTIIITIIIGFRMSRRDDLHPYIKILIIWISVLLLVNFASMYYTIGNYIKHSSIIGEKGQKGDNGPRGYRGSSFVCNQCGDAGKEEKEIYGSNVNDDDQVIDDPKLLVGKCEFPFVHNNEFQYDCVTEPREEGKMNDAGIYGWCATSRNNDLTYKTYGYCKNSDIEKKRFETNNTRASKLQQYQRTNYGIIDVDIVQGNRSNAKCPAGYEKIDVDLNESVPGNYIYMCVKKGLNDFGITDVKTITDTNSCGAGYSLIDVDLNNGTNGTPVKMCKKRGNSNFIKDIKIQKNRSCPVNYELLDTNLNLGLGGTPLFTCVNKTTYDESKTIDMAFVWGNDNSIYIFRDDSFWKYDDKKQQIAVEYPLKIAEKWGKLPSKLDAALTYPGDGETYFFKGDLFYKYDARLNKVADGFPKSIKSYWKGVPNNLDAIYVKGRKVYFIKGNDYFLWDEKTKNIKSGYPKKINNKFKGVTTFPSAVIYYPFQENTLYIEGNDVRIYKNDKEQSNSPKSLQDQFIGLI